jgi:nucleoside-diphosphate-sugar epimerase
MALYLVTGGAGFIGSSIAEALLAQGDRVRVLDDFSSGRRVNIETLPGKVELIEGTIVDPATVEQAVKGVDVIFHQAAIPSVVRSVEHPQPSMLSGAQGTTVLLDVARHAGVRRVVYAGSSSVYGETPTLPKIETMTPKPVSPYALSKLAGEHAMRIFARLYGIETLTLRYFNVFGARQNPQGEYAAVVPRFITAAIRRERPVVFGDGEQTRDFCHIDNVVRANLLAASTPRKLSGEFVNLACGARTSLNQLISFIGEIAGTTLPADYRPVRPGDVRDSLADISAARELIGFEPSVDVREGIRRTYEAFKSKSA